MSTKKEYNKPSVENYGTAEEITRDGGAPASDGQGVAPSAYSAGHPKA